MFETLKKLFTPGFFAAPDIRRGTQQKRVRSGSRFTRQQHEKAARLKGIEPHGRGVSRYGTVLVNPELRKRRSQRDASKIVFVNHTPP